MTLKQMADVLLRDNIGHALSFNQNGSTGGWCVFNSAEPLQTMV